MKMSYLQLLLSFLQIGLFSIGGGYAALPIIQDQVVHVHGWLTMREFADILTISQMTPGPIAINAASFVGTKIDGLPGAITASIGVVIPSFIIVLTLSYLYYKYRQLTAIQAVLKGLRPAVVALIASAGVSLGIDAFWQGKTIGFTTINIESVVLFIAAFFVLRKYKKSPITVMACSGMIAVAFGFITGQLTL